MLQQRNSAKKQTVIDDQEEDIMTLKELDRLNVLWRTMKESKKTLNTSSITTVTAPNNNNIHKRGSISNSFVLHPDKRSSRSNSYCDVSQLDRTQEDKSPTFKLYQQQLDESHNLQVARESNNKLSKKLTEAEEELEKCHEKIGRLMNSNQTQNAQLREMTQKLEHFSTYQKNLVEKSKLNTTLIEQDLEEKESQIDEQRRAMRQLESKYSEMVRMNKDFQAEKIQLTESFQLKNQENERLKARLIEAEKALDEVYMQRVKQSAENLEIKSLKSDVERLFALLKTTQEFRDFALYAEDSKDVSFLKHIYRTFDTKTNFDSLNHSFSNNCSKTRHSRKSVGAPCRCFHGDTQQNLLNEQLIWVPKDAMRFLQEFSVRHSGKLQPENLEDLLFNLSKHFSQREEARLQRLKKTFQDEIAQLRRQICQHTQFDELQARRRVMRLKNDIKKVQTSGNNQTNITQEVFISISDISTALFDKKTPSKSPFNARSTSGNIALSTVNQRKMVDFEDVVRLATEYQSEIRLKDQQIDSLSLQAAKTLTATNANVDTRQNRKDSSTAEKEAYVEGTIWMARKMLREIQKLKGNTLQIQGDFSQKIEKHLIQVEADKVQPKIIFESYQCFVEGLEQIIDKMQERVDQMRKSSQKQLVKIGETIKENNDVNMSSYIQGGTLSTKNDTTISHSLIPSKDTNRGARRFQELDDRKNLQNLL